jgi:hypothetical protein
MPGQLSPKGAISRQAILAAAYPLFPEKGYHGTSSRDMRGCILREAGIVRAQHRLQRIAAPPLAIVSLCQKWCLIEKESRRSRAWTKRLICSDPSSSLTARGCLRTPIPARSTSRSRRRWLAQPVEHAARLTRVGLVFSTRLTQMTRFLTEKRF